MVNIDLDGVGLDFKVRRFKHLTLKEFLVRGLFKRATNPVIHVHALQDISLHVGEGERLGVIGHNGAGKSTLLKLLAGIYEPTRGTRAVRGRISSLFDITLGFEPDASGWENMYYRGYLQGETPRTIRAKVDAIAEFTELGEFLDMPVRYYSAGMMIRLAFAIATASEPEILIVDEVLSVGDLSFQQKASQRIRAMMAQARLMVIVSHDLRSLQGLCTRVVWLDHGRVRQVGPPAETIAAYQAHFQRTAA
ncbi:MAG TPA: ABC transporter ATP-binding protein [Gemmataceae bacterium]|jgi:ABC-type polysaccharide/polyol phosphate transport system ATPase subunit